MPVGCRLNSQSVASGGTQNASACCRHRTYFEGVVDVNRMQRLTALSLLSALVAASCGGGSGSSAPPPAPGPGPGPGPSGTVDNPGQLSPNLVDHNVAALATEFHVVIPPAITPINKLFVFLPGTKGVPNDYNFIVQAGARRGFHTIGLEYQNSEAVGSVCLNSTDVNCFWNVRRNVILGDIVSLGIPVTKPNSIVTRLTEAIAYLDQAHKSEGWGQYIRVDGTLDWSKIVVGGHTQGGGHAGVMAKLYAMSRTCYFSSPPDYSGGPADWMTKPNMTPATQQYGFAGISDPSVPIADLRANFSALGLVGPETSVDSNVSPYGNSHVLTTDHAPNPSTDIGTPLHGLTVRDTFTPRDSSGQPLFEAAWNYLCFQ